MASSRSLTLMTHMTGPKISSEAMTISGLTFSKMVGPRKPALAAERHRWPVLPKKDVIMAAIVLSTSQSGITVMKFLALAWAIYLLPVSPHFLQMTSLAVAVRPTKVT